MLLLACLLRRELQVIPGLHSHSKYPRRCCVQLDPGHCVLLFKLYFDRTRAILRSDTAVAYVTGTCSF